MKTKKDKELGKLITMEDVQEFWRGTFIGQIKDETGDNSYVGSLPREQYHIDIAYISKFKTAEEVKAAGVFLPEDEANKDQRITDDGVQDVDAQAADEELQKKKGLKNIPALYGSKAKAFICIDVFSKKVSITPVAGTTQEDAVLSLSGSREVPYVYAPPGTVPQGTP